MLRLHEVSLISNREFYLTMPWPPSVNHCWRRVGNATIMSKETRQYKKLIRDMIYLHGKLDPLEGRLSMQIEAYPPDKRKRDLSNLIKVPEDALQEAGLYLNDNQIDDLSIKRMDIKIGGELRVLIKEL